MIDSATFGIRLRTLREQRGISLNSMARTLGVSSGYLSNLEIGKTEHISFTTLHAISSVLEMEICPLCNQIVNGSSASSEHADLALRVDLIHQAMSTLIAIDSDFLKQVLKLLENGLFRNEENLLQKSPMTFESRSS